MVVGVVVGEVVGDEAEPAAPHVPPAALRETQRTASSRSRSTRSSASARLLVVIVFCTWAR